MAPRKAVRRKAKPAVKSPQEELIRLYGDDDNDSDRVEVELTHIYVDGDDISTIEDAFEMTSCCGVLELKGVDDIAPRTEAGFAAVEALYTEHWKRDGYASVVATVNSVGQKSALAFFTAMKWTKIPIGKNREGQALVMFLKLLRP